MTRFPATVLQINPHLLEQHTLEPFQKPIIWSVQNLPGFFNRAVVFRLKHWLRVKGIRRGNWDQRNRPFSERLEYHLLDDLNQSLPDFRNSVWYQQGLNTIAEGGIFAHKDLTARTTQDLDRIFSDYLVELLQTMKKEGYRQRASADYPEAMIGRDGTLIKTACGTHRLAAAKVTGAPGLFPVQIIGVHRKWLSTLHINAGEPQHEVIFRALKDVEARYRRNCTSVQGTAAGKL